MIKPTKRKAFSFLRSYFDVLNQIPDKEDKLSFLLAIINKQFLDENPKDLTFVANLSYESQRHMIESSVKGYITKMKTDMQGNPIAPPTEPPSQGATQPPSEQEKEEGEEKEEIVSIIDWGKLLSHINNKTNKIRRVVSDKAKTQFKARLKEGYTKEDIFNAINNAVLDDYHIEKDFKYLTPEYFSRAKTLDLHGSKENTIKRPEKSYDRNYLFPDDTQ